MLDRIRERFPEPPRRSGTLWRYLAELLAQAGAHGSFNVLMSDGRDLFAYCSTRMSWLTRCAPFGPVRLVDAEVEVDFERETTPDDVVTVIATQPLTSNEVWNRIEPGTLIVFRDGLPTEVSASGGLRRLPVSSAVDAYRRAAGAAPQG